MKKAASLILALALCMALAVPAFAIPLDIKYDSVFSTDGLYDGTLRYDGEDVPVYAISLDGEFWIRPSWNPEANKRHNATVTAYEVTVDKGAAVISGDPTFHKTWEEWEKENTNIQAQNLYVKYTSDSADDPYTLIELKYEDGTIYRAIVHGVAKLESVDLGKTETVSVGGASMTLTNVVGRTTKTILDWNGAKQEVEVLLLGKGGGMLIYSIPESDEDYMWNYTEYVCNNGVYSSEAGDGASCESGEKSGEMYTPDDFYFYGAENPGIVYRALLLEDWENRKGFYFMMGTEADATSQSAPVAAEKPKVALTKQNLTVNGVAKTTQIYNINGANYFKLRDMAALLNGTGSQFDVDYRSADNTVVITTAAAYTHATGGELKTGVDRSATAEKSAQTVLLNGEPVELNAYNIGGSNFFKLRDLGTALNFGVDYDEASATMIVTSK